VRINLATGVPSILGFSGFNQIKGVAYDPVGSKLYAADSGSMSLISLDLATGAGTALGGLATSAAPSGLTWDSTGSTLYGTASNRLYTFNTTTGAGTLVATLSVGVTNYYPDALVYLPATDSLIGFSRLTGEIFQINKTTGAIGLVVPTQNNINGLAYDSATDAIYGNFGGTLVTVNVTTGAITQLRAFRFYSVTGLAYDPGANQVYGIRQYPLPELIAIDPVTGSARSIGPTAPSDLQALAFDPKTGTLYATQAVNSDLYTINRFTGAATKIGSHTLGSLRITGLEFDPATDTLYGAEESFGGLYKINTVTGSPTFIGSLGVMGMSGLALDPATGILYGSYGSTLYRINKTTGRATRIGTSVLGFAGLAWDPIRHVLLGSNGGGVGESDGLYRIDPVTGRATSVGSMGGRSMHGLTYDPLTRTVYGVFTFNASTNYLVTIDTSTGESTFVAGITNGAVVEALAYDTSTRTLYGADSSNAGQLITIDSNTGQRTVVGSMNFSMVSAMAYDYFNHVLYGVSDGTDQLITINPANGQGTLVGSIGFGNVEGLTFDPVGLSLYGCDYSARQIIQINPATGAGALIGSTPVGLRDVVIR
jgi:hypothetical protein